MPEDYSLVELCDVSLRVHANQVVMLTVAVSTPGVHAPVCHGRAFMGDDRLESACDEAGRLLAAWAAVGELGVALLVENWRPLPA